MKLSITSPAFIKLREAIETKIPKVTYLVDTNITIDDTEMKQALSEAIMSFDTTELETFVGFIMETM